MQENQIEAGKSTDDPHRDKLATSKWFALIHRGSMAFRFGPFDPPAIGKLMEQCHKEGIPAVFTADMGPERGAS